MAIGQGVLIFAIGLAAGFININAGGGSMLTIPVLIFLGYPSAVANGTNRIAIMVESIIAVANFKSKGYFDWKLGLKLGVPALIGAIIGSSIAVDMSDEIFNRILAVVMLVVMALIILEPQKKLMNYSESLTLKTQITAVIVFFIIGVYGGMIQVGVGFLMIAGLALITGSSLVNVNSLKTFIVAVYMLASLLVFVANGRVDWLAGLILGAGDGLGAYFGSNFAVKKGDKWIKIILLIAILFMSAKLLGILNF